jgi:hypothetical protein
MECRISNKVSHSDRYTLLSLLLFSLSLSLNADCLSDCIILSVYSMPKTAKWVKNWASPRFLWLRSPLSPISCRRTTCFKESNIPTLGRLSRPLLSPMSLLRDIAMQPLMKMTKTMSGENLLHRKLAFSRNGPIEGLFRTFRRL